MRSPIRSLFSPVIPLFRQKPFRPRMRLPTVSISPLPVSITGDKRKGLATELVSQPYLILMVFPFTPDGDRSRPTTYLPSLSGSGTQLAAQWQDEQEAGQGTTAHYHAGRHRHVADTHQRTGERTGDKA